MISWSRINRTLHLCWLRDLWVDAGGIKQRMGSATQFSTCSKPTRCLRRRCGTYHLIRIVDAESKQWYSMWSLDSNYRKAWAVRCLRWCWWGSFSITAKSPGLWNSSSLLIFGFDMRWKRMHPFKELLRVMSVLGERRSSIVSATLLAELNSRVVICSSYWEQNQHPEPCCTVKVTCIMKSDFNYEPLCVVVGMPSLYVIFFCVLCIVTRVRDFVALLFNVIWDGWFHTTRPFSNNTLSITDTFECAYSSIAESLSNQSPFHLFGFSIVRLRIRLLLFQLSNEGVDTPYTTIFST